MLRYFETEPTGLCQKAEDEAASQPEGNKFTPELRATVCVDVFCVHKAFL